MKKLVVAVVCVGFWVNGAGPAEAGTDDDASQLVICFWDNDGDGYYRDGQTRFTTTYVIPGWGQNMSPSLWTGVCPTRWASQPGDCNDSDNQIHPFVAERENAVDDDCDGSTDEPNFLWPLDLSSYYHGTNWVRVAVHYNDVYTRYLGENGYRLRALYSYRSLEGTGSGNGTSELEVDEDYSWDVFTIGGLLAGTVYEVRIDRIEYQSNGNWYPVPDVSDYQPLSSERFYTMTRGGGETGMGNDRTRIVISALSEWSMQLNGSVGYEGEYFPDGARYLGADIGYPWCSEFYSQVASTRVDRIMAPTIADLASWFTARGSYYYDEMSGWNTYYSYLASPGDWMWIQTGGRTYAEKMSRGHSTMILGYDRTAAQVTVISGNVGNRVSIDTYSTTSDAVRGGGLGHLRPSMMY
ncbi:MAG: putative metal-binding motif-containing protein [Myxococcales bacterium]|nr:putative metal-binding motif-containing protein [Myxococcales bacterium]